MSEAGPHDDPTRADEATMLTAYLETQREALRRLAGDLDQAALARSLPPSPLTLGGLVKHLALVEGWWLVQVLRGEGPPTPFAEVDWEADPDWEFHSAQRDSPEELWRVYDEAVTRSRAAVAEAVAGSGLDTLSVRTSRERTAFSLRWILLHLLAEYARHLGHADLIRESIDGRTGL